MVKTAPVAVEFLELSVTAYQHMWKFSAKNGNSSVPGATVGLLFSEVFSNSKFPKVS